MLVKETSPGQGKSRGRVGRGSTTVLQNYSTTVSYIYIPYNDLQHQKRQEKTLFQDCYRGTDGQTDIWMDGRTYQHGTVELRVHEIREWLKIKKYERFTEEINE